MSIDDEAHVNNIAVAPGWTGRRLGTVLLYDLVRTALARGSAHLTLEVAVGNEPAIALYRRFGTGAGRACGRTTTADGDALIMWVRDIDSGRLRRRGWPPSGRRWPTAVDLERRD